MRMFLIAALAVAISGTAEAKSAACSLTVSKREVFKGACDYTADRDGSFQLVSPSGFFVYVNISAPGQADGYWNGWDKGNHAHTGLGILLREDIDRACWSNGYAQVCAR